MEKELQYEDRREPKGDTIKVWEETDEEMVANRYKKGWIVDKIIDTERGEFYIFKEIHQASNTEPIHYHGAQKTIKCQKYPCYWAGV